MRLSCSIVFYCVSRETADDSESSRAFLPSIGSTFLSSFIVHQLRGTLRSTSSFSLFFALPLLLSCWQIYRYRTLLATASRRLRDLSHWLCFLPPSPPHCYEKFESNKPKRCGILSSSSSLFLSGLWSRLLPLQTPPDLPMDSHSL